MASPRSTWSLGCRYWPTPLRRSAGSSLYSSGFRRRGLMIVAFGVCIAVGALAAGALTVSTVSAQSMAPTLLPGSRVVVVRVPGALLRLLNRPRRGDVVVLRLSGQQQRFVKRVIALAGDSIAVEGDALFLNGARLNEPYRQRSAVPTKSPSVWPALGRAAPLLVPSGMVVVLGDNRSESADSRIWGAVPESALEGLVVAAF